MHVLNPKSDSSIIPGLNCKFDAVETSCIEPSTSLLLSLGTVLIFFDGNGGVDLVGLYEQGAVVNFLDSSLVEIVVFYCDVVSIFLVFASECSFVDPLAVIVRKTIKVDPDCAWVVGDHSLGPVGVY